MTWDVLRDPISSGRVRAGGREAAAQGILLGVGSLLSVLCLGQDPDGSPCVLLCVHKWQAVADMTSKGSDGVALGHLSFPEDFVCLGGSSILPALHPPGSWCHCFGGHPGVHISVETELVPAVPGQLVPWSFLALKVWGRWGSESQGIRRRAGLG